MARNRTYSDEQLTQAVKESSSYTGVLRKLGLSTSGTESKKRIEFFITKSNIDVSHFEPFRRDITQRRKYAVEEVLIKRPKGSTVGGTTNRRAKQALIEIGVPYECALCGQLPFHNGKPLNLQLDHISGDSTDYRKDNLRFICPNCHTQTETYVKGTKK